MHGHNNMSASNCARVMRVARVRVRVRGYIPVFEKAHALMKRTVRVTESIRKIAGQGRRRRRMTCSPGSVWPIVSLL